MRTLFRGPALVTALATLLVAAALAGLPAQGRAAVGTSVAVHPSADFSLGYDGISPAAISLNWTASTAGDFENYSVFYSTKGATGPWTFYTAVTDEGTPAVVVAGLTPGAKYWWNVTAYTSGILLGIGATTTYSTILDQAQPTLAHLIASKETSDAVTVNWTNNATYTSSAAYATYGVGILFGSYVVAVESGGTTEYQSAITDEATNTTTVESLSPGTNGYSFYLETSDCVAACSGSSPQYSTTQSNVVVAGTAVGLTAAVSPLAVTTDVGLPVAFACTPAGGTPPYAFGWNFTSGSTYAAGPGTSGTTYTAAGTYTVTCKVTASSGSTVTAPVTVTVNPVPKLTASASAGNVTVGTSVTFRCAATPGSPPVTVRWSFGDGSSAPAVVGADSPGTAWSNATWSYASSGTYVAQCTVVDTVGGRAVASVVVHVQPKPGTPWLSAWLILLGALAAGIVVAVVAGVTRRRDEDARRSSAMSRWLPPTGPAAAVHGAKVCPKCGASNVPLRRTCQACGTPLPRTPSP